MHVITDNSKQKNGWQLPDNGWLTELLSVVTFHDVNNTVQTNWKDT